MDDNIRESVDYYRQVPNKFTIDGRKHERMSLIAIQSLHIHSSITKSMLTLNEYVSPRRSHSSGINKPFIYQASPLDT